MIFSAYDQIGDYFELDVECEKCGKAATVPRPDTAACDRLINGYYYNLARAELELLNRAARIFDTYPQSNHPYIILKQYRDSVENPEDDSQLQQAVNEDPPLREFLSQSEFNFHSRRSGVANSIRKLQLTLTVNITQCPECGGACCLTEECHDACGGLFFSESSMERWNAKRIDTRGAM